MKKSLGSFVVFNRRMFLLLGVVLCVAGFGIASWQINAAGASQNENAQNNGKEPSNAGNPSATPVDSKPAQRVEATFRGVITPSKSDTSIPLRDMKPILGNRTPKRPNEERDIIPRTPEIPKELWKNDPVVQSFLGDREIPNPIVSFDGSPTSTAGSAPPDPNGDVGLNHVITTWNAQFQIFTKTGTSVFGPANINTLFSGFGGACQTENAGDPVVLYDQLADRWFIMQFTAAGPSYFVCVAVSTSPDPTGTYTRYAIPTGTNFPDYPKAGVWSDAYYVSTREFTAAGPFAGVGAYAINRAQAIAGNPAAQVLSFLAPPVPDESTGDGLLPADLDGPTAPPAGSPNYFVGTQDTNGPYTSPSDAINIWKFTANFTTPASSSFVLANTIPVGSFNSILARCAGTRACIPQQGTTHQIDHLGYRQRPLFRLAYRNFGTHESLVTNQSVSGGNGPNGEVSGIRWWEIRSPNSSPVIFQEGTYAPGVTDGIHRWMGAIAMDQSGNMGMGYSASSATMFPSIFYTGRLVNDPLGTMPQGEASIMNGTGSATSLNRWGDYTSMSVDPSDDCTFWHVNEYYPATSATGWRLRVGSFKFPTCGVPTGTLSGTVTNCATSAPISGANVTLTPGGYVGGSIGSGAYTVTAPGGSYTATATAAGYSSGAGATGPVTITNGANTVANFCLTGLPAVAPGVAAPTLISESCTPANGVIDPGEQVTVRFPVRNTGAANTVNDIGTLQASGNVTSPGPAQSYGVIVAGGADKTADFTFRADPAMVCGTNITATIAHNDSGSLGNVVYTLPTGANGAPATTSYTGAPVAIPDNNTTGVNVNLPVATAGVVGDLDFRFDTSGGVCDTTTGDVDCAVDHTWVGDLVFTLTSPAGTSVTFIDRIGVPATATGNSGNNFGLATIDDDGAFPAIENFAGAPVAGNFSPNNPFSAFDGQPANGTWILNVSDRAGADTGSVRRFSLIITPKTCSTNCTTAAGVEVSGRVLTSAGGRGLRGAVVTLRDESGNELRTITGAMGNFRFAEVEPGHTYIVTIRNRRFQFAPQVLTINDSITDLVFTPE